MVYSKHFSSVRFNISMKSCLETLLFLHFQINTKSLDIFWVIFLNSMRIFVKRIPGTFLPWKFHSSNFQPVSCSDDRFLPLVKLQSPILFHLFNKFVISLMALYIIRMEQSTYNQPFGTITHTETISLLGHFRTKKFQWSFLFIMFNQLCGPQSLIRLLQHIQLMEDLQLRAIYIIEFIQILKYASPQNKRG